MEEREALLMNVRDNFVTDLVLSIRPLDREEQIHFMDQLSECMKGIYGPAVPFCTTGNSFDADHFLENNLLRPYRDKMAAFVQSGLRYYLTGDEFSQSILFAKLNISEPHFSRSEQLNLAQSIYLILRHTKERLYLTPIDTLTSNQKDYSKPAVGENETEEHGFKSRSLEYTRSRQVLLYYFVLKLIGLTKLNNSSRKYAQFAHVLFAYPIDNIDNSPVYKLLKKAPYLKKDKKEMLRDLKFIQTQFALIGSDEGVSLVQKEIDLLQR